MTNKMVSLPGLARRMFTRLARTNPDTINEICENVASVAAKLKTPPADKMAVEHKAQLLRELFKPHKDTCTGISSLCMGISSSVADGPFTVMENLSLAKVKNNPRALLELDDIASKVLSVTIDPKNARHSYFQFQLNTNETCSLEVQESSIPAETGVSIKITGGEYGRIDTLYDFKAGDNLQILLKMKADALNDQINARLN